ncbi:hypothetical protein JXO59_01570 [candidate division KSB1 bacterium]|nr:hypothetical protein [candidate division KSB1 bacterium]
MPPKKMDRPESIAELVVKICHQRAEKNETETFAKACMVHAIAFLQMLEKTGRLVRESNRNEEWQMLAADCIADLFRRDRQGRFIQIQRFFKNILETAYDDNDINFFLRKLVCHKVRQHLIILFRQRDPVGAKIWRNLVLAFQSEQNVSIRKDLTGQYLIIQPAGCAQEASVVSINYFELEARLSAVFRTGYTIKQLSSSLLASLAEVYTQPIEVNLSHLTTLIKQFRKQAQRNQDNKMAAPPTKAMEQIELYDRKRDILNELRNRLEDGYIRTGKLTPQQATYIHLALADLLDDILLCEKPEKNYIYLKKYWSDLSREEYLRTVHTLFEYLILQMKQMIRLEYKKIF